MDNQRVKHRSPRNIIARTALLMTAFYCSSAWADWHSGFVTTLNTAYDGITVTLSLSNWSRTNCTCYSTWSSNMCLDRGRETFTTELSMLLAAKLADRAVSVNINETTCSIVSVSIVE
jgi:hypothetical protein